MCLSGHRRALGLHCATATVNRIYDELSHRVCITNTEICRFYIRYLGRQGKLILAVIKTPILLKAIPFDEN
jgi:hypothetical protein